MKYITDFYKFIIIIVLICLIYLLFNKLSIKDGFYSKTCIETPISNENYNDDKRKPKPIKFDVDVDESKTKITLSWEKQNILDFFINGKNDTLCSIHRNKNDCLYTQGCKFKPKILPNYDKCPSNYKPPNFPNNEVLTKDNKPKFKREFMKISSTPHSYKSPEYNFIINRNNFVDYNSAGVTSPTLDDIFYIIDPKGMVVDDKGTGSGTAAVNVKIEKFPQSFYNKTLVSSDGFIKIKFKSNSLYEYVEKTIDLESYREYRLVNDRIQIEDTKRGKGYSGYKQYKTDSTLEIIVLDVDSNKSITDYFITIFAVAIYNKDLVKIGNTDHEIDPKAEFKVNYLSPKEIILKKLRYEKEFENMLEYFDKIKGDTITINEDEYIFYKLDELKRNCNKPIIKEIGNCIPTYSSKYMQIFDDIDFVKNNIEQITDVNKKYTYYDKIIKFLEEYSEKNKPGEVVEAFNNPLEDLIAKYKNLRQQPPKDYRPIDIYINPRYRIIVYIIKIYINGEGPYIYRIKPEKLKQVNNNYLFNYFNKLKAVNYKFTITAINEISGKSKIESDPYFRVIDIAPYDNTNIQNTDNMRTDVYCMGDGQHLIKNTNMDSEKCGERMEPILAHEYIKDIQNKYIGDGFATDFPITFPYFMDKDIKVRVNDNEQSPESNGDYKLQNSVIKFNKPPGKGSNIIIETVNDIYNKYRYQEFNMNTYDDLMDNLNTKQNLKYSLNLKF